MSETKPVLWNRNFVQCCISYFLMNFAFYMLMPTMPVYLVEELGISTSEVGMVLSSYTIGLLCVRPFSGYLVDCFSRKPLYVFAFTIFACLCFHLGAFVKIRSSFGSVRRSETGNGTIHKSNHFIHLGSFY